MTALDQFQLDTLDFLDKANGRAVVADPMGARKTGTVLAWCEASRFVDSVLVVAPASVHGHWAREAARFAPDFGVYIGRGTPAAMSKALAGVASEDKGAILITNYECMKRDQHSLYSFDTIVFDEGHKLKGRTTQVALCATALAKNAERCIIVTGTPVMNHAAELWQYLRMVDPKAYPSFWRWAEEHFFIEQTRFQGNRFPTKIIHEARNEEALRKQTEGIIIQRDIKDLFPDQAWIAEPEHVEISVQLSPAERKAYDQLVKHKWTIIGDSEVTTNNALDLSTRLAQITSDWGALGGEEGGTKVEATVELVLDLLERDEPVLVFAKYKATVERIVALLNAKDVHASPYTGDESSFDRDANVAEFSGGMCDVLVGTLDSLSEGVDGLQHRCANVVFVDRHWTPAKNDQAIGRLRRSGQERRVTVWHVFAEDTIDATITDACLRKTNLIEALKGRPLLDSLYGRVK